MAFGAKPALPCTVMSVVAMKNQTKKVEASFRTHPLSHRVLPYPFDVLPFKNAQAALLAGLGVAAHELVDAAGCIYELGLASVEGVRRAGDFQLYNRISFAFKLNGVVGFAG